MASPVPNSKPWHPHDYIIYIYITYNIRPYTRAYLHQVITIFNEDVGGPVYGPLQQRVQTFITLLN